MTRPEISGISPFFIVRDAATALSFYREQLGFEITFQEPADDPFFVIVARGGAMIMLKDVGVDPLPNYKREPAARWDAYLYVLILMRWRPKFTTRNVEFSEPLKDTYDGLRGFELKDCDGYVLFSVILGHECRSNVGMSVPCGRNTPPNHAPEWNSVIAQDLKPDGVLPSR